MFRVQRSRTIENDPARVDAFAIDSNGKTSGYTVVKTWPVCGFRHDLGLQCGVARNDLDCELNERDIGDVCDGRGPGTVIEDALPDKDRQCPVSNSVDFTLVILRQIGITTISA